jgi:3-hydroxyisobutyrate dehydrogenase
LSDAPFVKLEKHASWLTSLFRAHRLADFSSCQTVILMLPNSAAVTSVVLGDKGESGLANALRPGARIVDMGSSDPIETRRLAATLKPLGINLVDAPVSGAVAKARTGELAIMIGARGDELDAVRPLLSCMGSSIISCGEVGSAHAMKALNNYVYAAGLRAVAEAVLIAEKSGLDTTVFADVLNASSGRNVATETKLKQFILPGEYAGGFLMRLQAKDLAIADRLRMQSGIDAGQLAACAALWTQASEAMPDADNTAIHRYLRNVSGGA